MSQYLAERGCSVEGVDLSPGMVAMARRNHPGFVFTVGSLTELPYPDGQFAGVMLWYSIIHAPPAGQARIFAEAARVLRPAGHLLVGFQSGKGTRDVSGAYRQFGHEIELERHLYTADDVGFQIEAAGLREVCRLVRRAQEGAGRSGDPAGQGPMSRTHIDRSLHLAALVDAQFAARPWCPDVTCIGCRRLAMRYRS